LQNDQLCFGHDVRFNTIIWLAMFAGDPHCELFGIGKEGGVCHRFGEKAMANGIST
jgi:hypothetical protein